MSWAALGIDVLFASVIATALLFYALAFKANGAELSASNFIHIIFHPYFMGGLVLAFSSSIMRIILFDLLGYTRTALVSQLAALFSVVLLWAVFKEALTPRQIAGGALLIGGLFLVASK